MQSRRTEKFTSSEVAQAGASWSLDGWHGHPHNAWQLVVRANVEDCAGKFGSVVVAATDHDASRVEFVPLVGRIASEGWQAMEQASKDPISIPSVTSKVPACDSFPFPGGNAVAGQMAIGGPTLNLRQPVGVM